MDAVVVLWTYDENSLSGIHRKRMMYQVGVTVWCQ